MNRNLIKVLIVLMLLSATGCSNAKECFKTVGSMSTSRSHHSAVLLQDGRVLVTGGTLGFKTLKSAEIFDPKTNKFHLITDMNVPHRYHSSIPLKDGRILILGGMSIGLNDTTTVEIFDPKTEKFSYITDTNYSHCPQKAILLDSGEVLVVGGRISPCFEIFDPKTNTFKLAGKFPDFTLNSFDMVKLNDGRVAIFGGLATSLTKFGGTAHVPNMDVNKTVFIYDPKTEKIEKAGELIIPRPYLSAILIDNYNILIVGGNNKQVQKKAEIYNFKTQKSQSINDTNIYYINHTLTLLKNGKILLVGGYYDKLSKKAELFDPKTNKFQLLNMKFDRGSQTATLLKDGRVLITGGATLRANPKRAEIFDYECNK
jgi:hypothetical protein